MDGNKQTASWYKKINLFKKCISSTPEDNCVVLQPIQSSLRLNVDSAIKRNCKLRSWHRDMESKLFDNELKLINKLGTQIYGQIIVTTDKLKKYQLKNKRLCSVLKYNLELNQAFSNAVREMEGMIKAIEDQNSTWDAEPFLENSVLHLQQILEEVSESSNNLFSDIRLIILRLQLIGNVEKHLESEWPKLDEKEAIIDYVDVLKFHNTEIGLTIKSEKKHNEKLAKKYKILLTKFIKFSNHDKFTCKRFKMPIRKCRLALTTANLDIFNHINSLFQESDPNLQAENVRLANALNASEKQQIESLNELQRCKDFEIKFQESKKHGIFLENALQHKSKLLTQIAIENLIFRQKIPNISFQKFPESENTLIQKLIENELQLKIIVKELEEKFEGVMRQQEKHKKNSRNISQTLKTLTDYLNEITQDFLLNEEENSRKSQVFIDTLIKERMEELMRSLDEKQIKRLEEAIDQDHLEDILTELQQQILEQREHFYKLTQDIGHSDLAKLIGSLSNLELQSLAEAVANERFEAIVNVLQMARRNEEQQVCEPSCSKERISEIVKLMEQLHSKVRQGFSRDSSNVNNS